MIVRALILLSALGALAPAPADARPRDREQDRLFRGIQDGSVLPLRVIEARIIPRMPGFDYIGPELVGNRYRLKFMRGAQVVWIDVDPRTGQIIGKSGF